jgi:RHS repeat-associated protein
MAAKRKTLWLLAVLLVLCASSAFASIPKPDITLQPGYEERLELFTDEAPAEIAWPVIDVATFEWLDEVSHVEIDLPNDEPLIGEVDLFEPDSERSIFAVKEKLASGVLGNAAENNVSSISELVEIMGWGEDIHAYPFVEPANGKVYARARWYDSQTGTFMSPDPMGYVDSSNLYAGFAGDPVNNGDPRGEAVYVVYREFADPKLRDKYPDAGHLFLAFDAEGLSDADRWNRLVRDSGKSGQFSSSRPNPNLQTFSFHPKEVCTGSKRQSLAGTIYTRGACIGYDDRIDQEEFDVARATAASGRQPVRQRIWRIDASQDEQEKLFRAAISQRNAMAAGRYPAGSYMLLENNCGTWAKKMVESGGLIWPAAASLCNLGTGVGGPSETEWIVEKSLAVVTTGAIIYGEVKKLFRDTKEAAEQWLAQMERGARSAALGPEVPW